MKREKIEEFYRSVGSIYCPYFRDIVIFNAKGLYHLHYKSGKRPEIRSKKEIAQRYKVLNLAPKLVSITTTVQEFELRGGKKYWGFIAILESRKVKVVVRQVGNGKKHFWSIIPNWVTRKKSDKKSTC